MFSQGRLVQKKRSLLLFNNMVLCASLKRKPKKGELESSKWATWTNTMRIICLFVYCCCSDSHCHDNMSCCWKIWAHWYLISQLKTTGTTAIKNISSFPWFYCFMILRNRGKNWPICYQKLMYRHALRWSIFKHQQHPPTYGDTGTSLVPSTINWWTGFFSNK